MYIQVSIFVRVPFTGSTVSRRLCDTLQCYPPKSTPMASAEAQRRCSFPSESLHKVQLINTNAALGDYKKQLDAFLENTQVRLPHL